jgi:hypothetical protein
MLCKLLSSEEAEHTDKPAYKTFPLSDTDAITIQYFLSFENRPVLWATGERSYMKENCKFYISDPFIHNALISEIASYSYAFKLLSFHIVSETLIQCFSAIQFYL